MALNLASQPNESIAEQQQPLAEVSASRTLGAGLTIEHLLFALWLGVAFFVRAFALGEPPLTGLEAANVWPAWLAAANQSAPGVTLPATPLFYAISTTIFWLVGSGDAIARAVPLLAGLVMVVASWGFRPWLGRQVTLLLILLVALDPWLTFFSRLADGAVFSLCFGWLSLLGLLSLLQATPAQADLLRWRRLTTFSLGLLLVSGPLSWSFLVVLALLVAAYDPQAKHLRALGLGQRTDLLWLVAAAVLGATAWFAQPAGLGLISTSLTVWLRTWWGGEDALYPLSWLGLRLWADQLPLLILGGLGLLRLWWTPADSPLVAHEPSLRVGPWRFFLTAWLVWGILLNLLPGRDPINLPMITLPLLFAAADLAAAFLQRAAQASIWREGWLLIALATVLLTSASFWGAALFSQSQFEWNIVRGLLLFLLLLGLTVVLYALWAGWPVTRLLVGSYGIVLLLLITLSSNWHLNHRGLLSEPDGFFAEFTVDDVRNLASNVHLLSAYRTGDANQMPVLVQMRGTPDPVLGWYLRHLRNLRWVLAPEVSSAVVAGAPLVITQGLDVNDQQLVDYMGSRYLVHGRWLPSTLVAIQETAPAGQVFPEQIEYAWRAWLRNLFRWITYRKVQMIPPTEAVVLWVKAGE